MITNREEALTLELLSAIGARSDVTQRHLADRLGVALGLYSTGLARLRGARIPAASSGGDLRARGNYVDDVPPF